MQMSPPPPHQAQDRPPHGPITRPIEVNGLAEIVLAYPPGVGDKSIAADLARKTGHKVAPYTVSVCRRNAQDIAYRIGFLEVDRALIVHRLKTLADNIENRLSLSGSTGETRSPSEIKAANEEIRTLVMIYKTAYGLIGDEIQRVRELEIEMGARNAENEIIGFSEAGEGEEDGPAPGDVRHIRPADRSDLVELEEAFL